MVHEYVDHKLYGPAHTTYTQTRSNNTRTHPTHPRAHRYTYTNTHTQTWRKSQYTSYYIVIKHTALYNITYNTLMCDGITLKQCCLHKFKYIQYILANCAVHNLFISRHNGACRHLASILLPPEASNGLQLSVEQYSLE